MYHLVNSSRAVPGDYGGVKRTSLASGEGCHSPGVDLSERMRRRMLSDL